LILKGVDKKLLKSSGIGSEKPLADNTTAEGMEQNRRVEAHFKK
jgi:outer membrane protein OmpA-like peptidoglycan-associated protein